MTQTTDAALVERLRKRDREWQAKIDGWVKQAAEAGYAIKPDEEAIMRDTPGDRQAADIIEAQARRIEALEGALRKLEEANDKMAAGRSRAAYFAMIDAGQLDALADLDGARWDARALLTKALIP